MTGATAAPTTGGLPLPVDGAIPPLPLAASDENENDYEGCLSRQ